MRHALRDAAVAAAGLKDALFVRKRRLQELREAPELVRPENEAHERERALDLVDDLRLLCHAAADRDELVGLGLFGVRQSAEVSENALLRMLADGAGVHDDDVREIFVGRHLVAGGGEVAAQLFAVLLVLLAAVGVDEGIARPGGLGIHFRAQGELLFNFGLGYLFSHVSVSSYRFFRNRVIISFWCFIFKIFTL